MTNKNELTDKQQLFLDTLFNEELNPDMCPKIARDVAGYVDNVSVTSIISGIKASLQDDMQSFFLSNSPAAAKKIISIMSDKNPSPNSDRVLSAASQILDRAGVSKKDKQEVELKLPDGIVILPAIKDE